MKTLLNKKQLPSIFPANVLYHGHVIHLRSPISSITAQTNGVGLTVIDITIQQGLCRQKAIAIAVHLVKFLSKNEED